MGRLAHLQATLPVLLQGPVDVVVVDYSCPQKAGDWVERTYGHTGRVVVERVRGRRTFNKPEAHNRGAKRASKWKPGTYLCFVDADTIVTPQLWPWLMPRLRPDRFWFVEGWMDQPDVTGLLVVHAPAFAQSGGFDERMRGWGAEDLDMRLRLYFKMGLPFEEIPVAYVRAISHGDGLRVTNYTVANKWASHDHNLWLLAENFRKWTGHDLEEAGCDRTMWRLLGTYRWWQLLMMQQPTVCSQSARAWVGAYRSA